MSRGKTMSEQRIVYQRELPGGGYVNIESDAEADALTRAQVTVERRTDPARRDGHVPPIIAAAEGVNAQSVLRELMEIASDNVAIARALLRWKSDGRAKF
jgi:hypothetical protein